MRKRDLILSQVAFWMEHEFITLLPVVVWTVAIKISNVNLRLKWKLTWKDALCQGCPTGNLQEAIMQLPGSHPASPPPLLWLQQGAQDSPSPGF